MAETKIEKAMRTATAKHKGQWRDGENPLPYITHVAEVMANLRYVGGVVDEDMLCAAALHDVLECTETDAAELESIYGERAINLVTELTRTEPAGDQTEGLEKKDIRELRSKLLLDDIERMTPEAQTIKLADRLSNLRQALAVREGKKLARYRKQTKAILEIIDKDVNPGLHKAVSDLVND